MNTCKNCKHFKPIDQFPHLGHCSKIWDRLVLQTRLNKKMQLMSIGVQAEFGCVDFEEKK